MCPPQHQLLSRQSWLQILCFLLALANLITFSKLLYDYYQYKVRVASGLTMNITDIILGQWKAAGDNPLDSDSLIITKAGRNAM